jgi:hypothetical protein
MLDNVTGIAGAAELRRPCEGGDGDFLALFRQWVTSVRRIRDDDNIGRISKVGRGGWSRR